jgi:hypothetical protein
MWQDMPINKTKIMNWSEAESYCKSLTFAGYDDWELPSRETLQKLYGDRSNLHNTPSGYYWTSTSYSGNSSYAWRVYFHRGDDLWFDKSFYDYALCVR